MAEDIAPGLRKNVEQSYRNSVANDSELARIQKKIDEGMATGKDLDAYAVRSGELLAQALHEHVSGDILPNGRMYYNIANRLLPPVLRQNYEDVADVSDAIQTIMNEQAVIGIKAQRPELNEDRVEGLVDLAAEAEQYEDIRKELEGDVVNFSQSVATDSVKSNAEFQYQSGLSPKVERTAEPSCCPWCQNLEGTYDYADIRGTGNEVWKRHRACRCVVEYVAAGKRQNAHTKQVSTMDREASAERIQRAQKAEKQDREQAETGREKRIQSVQQQDPLGRNYYSIMGDMDPEVFEEAVRLWYSKEEYPRLTAQEKEHVYQLLDENSPSRISDPIVRITVDEYKYTAICKGHNTYKIIDKKYIDDPEHLTGWERMLDEILKEVVGDNWRKYDI